MAYRKINSFKINSRKELCDTMAKAMQEDFDIESDVSKISEYIDLLLEDFLIIPDETLDKYRQRKKAHKKYVV